VFPNRKQSWPKQAGQPVPGTLVGSIKAFTGDVSAKGGIKKYDLLPAWICHGRFTRPRGINHEPQTNHAVSPAFPSLALREQEAARKGGACTGKTRHAAGARDEDPRRKSTGRPIRGERGHQHRNEPLSNGNTGAGCYGITAPVASLTTGKQEAIDPPSHDGNNAQQCVHGAKIGTTMPIVAMIRRPGPAGHHAIGACKPEP
jgi:hypothetical protein